MRSCATILFGLITVLIVHIAQTGGNDLGVVLLHGKGGSPSGYVRELASALQSKGYLVSTPALPRAQNRIYDASFEEAMGEIDREVDSLRQKGAKIVVVAGHSLGANVALGYASSRDLCRRDYRTGSCPYSGTVGVPVFVKPKCFRGFEINSVRASVCDVFTSVPFSLS